MALNFSSITDENYRKFRLHLQSGNLKYQSVYFFVSVYIRTFAAKS